MRRPQDIINKRALAACRAYTRFFQGDSRPQPYLTGGTSAPQLSRMYQGVGLRKHGLSHASYSVSADARDATLIFAMATGRQASALRTYRGALDEASPIERLRTGTH